LKAKALVRKLEGAEDHPIEHGTVKGAPSNAPTIGGDNAPQSSRVLVMAVFLRVLVVLSPK
jgi:hypothetical protein